jgi:hypothetical protein
MSVLVVVRGHQGSGKTTLARAKYPNHCHVEADMFFEDERTGEYKFDPSMLSAAHEWCLFTVMSLMFAGQNVVVANTFSQWWEFRPYILAARKAGYVVCVVECAGDYESIHNVPPDVVERTKARHQPITYESDELPRYDFKEHKFYSWDGIESNEYEYWTGCKCGCPAGILDWSYDAELGDEVPVHECMDESCGYIF